MSVSRRVNSTGAGSTHRYQLIFTERECRSSDFQIRASFLPKPVAVSPASRRVTKTGLLPARRISRYPAGPGDRFVALLLQDRGRHLSAGRDQSPPQGVSQGHTARHFASSAKGLGRPPAPRTTRPTMAAAAELSTTRRNKPTRSEVSSESSPMAGDHPRSEEHTSEL